MLVIWDKDYLGFVTGKGTRIGKILRLESKLEFMFMLVFMLVFMLELELMLDL